ncbi:hypothetical protein SFC79_16910 [Nocardioides sp. S-58]|uniref:RNA polymerase, sigma 54 subunit, RpoN/SigL n=1 Tax=Nocardioides renjunii TaxID=3095075 RepID=A0ABU5KET4_9ACTN|nr:hypothetical protein [Nocardioides sp. S-58]MDZ5663456.1 hypothetical protein [Nocardioides sp. S-58]
MERSGPSLGMTPRLAARPGLRVLSYLALLPASAVELDAAVDRAVAENPLLERRFWRPCPTCGLATTGERCTVCSTARWSAEPEATSDWRADLLRDAVTELPDTWRPVLEEVVASLDDHGLLPDPPPVPAETLAAVVAGLRRAGPPGIAATSPIDCVRVQAAALVESGSVDPLVGEIAERWLPEVAEERFADVAESAGATERAVAAAVAVLRERTRPFVSLPGGAARSAPTDVVFTQPDRPGPVVAHVAGPDSAGIEVVTDVLADTDEARAWLAPHREAAARLVAQVAARGRMLQRVADEVALRQQGFIVAGPEEHRPLLRRDVAAALSVHPSTVGRVVGGKLARCPDGRVVPLADFFGATPSTAVRVATARAEHPGATDQQVADLLSRDGAAISRRTVAKYRARAANPASPRP